MGTNRDHPYLTVPHHDGKNGYASEEEIAVYRLPGEKLGLGLRFEGGTQPGEFISKLFIQSVNEGSPASRTRCSWGYMKDGDRIVAIDGIPVSRLTRSGCVSLMRDSSVSIRLMVRTASPELSTLSPPKAFADCDLAPQEPQIPACHTDLFAEDDRRNGVHPCGSESDETGSSASTVISWYRSNSEHLSRSSSFSGGPASQNVSRAHSFSDGVLQPNSESLLELEKVLVPFEQLEKDFGAWTVSEERASCAEAPGHDVKDESCSPLANGSYLNGFSGHQRSYETVSSGYNQPKVCCSRNELSSSLFQRRKLLKSLSAIPKMESKKIQNLVSNFEKATSSLIAGRNALPQLPASSCDVKTRIRRFEEQIRPREVSSNESSDHPISRIPSRKELFSSPNETGPSVLDAAFHYSLASSLKACGRNGANPESSHVRKQSLDDCGVSPVVDGKESDGDSALSSIGSGSSTPPSIGDGPSLRNAACLLSRSHANVSCSPSKRIFEATWPPEGRRTTGSLDDLLDQVQTYQGKKMFDGAADAPMSSERAELKKLKVNIKELARRWEKISSSEEPAGPSCSVRKRATYRSTVPICMFANCWTDKDEIDAAHDRGHCSVVRNIRDNFEHQFLSSKKDGIYQHHRFSSLDSTTSEDSSIPTLGFYGSLRESGSVTSLASSTSLISPQQLLEEANQSLEESGTASHEILVVVLHRENSTGGIGITLAGGSDYESKEVTVHKVIAGSVADRDGRIQKGDRILSINGRSMKGITHKEALTILKVRLFLLFPLVDCAPKSPRPEVVLVASRNRSSTPQEAASDGRSTSPSVWMDQMRLVAGVCLDGYNSSENEHFGPMVSVTLQNGGSGLGFSLEGGRDSPQGDRPLVIKKLFAGGVAEKNGKLAIGDQLIQINGADVRSMARIEAWHLLKKLPDGAVTITVRKKLCAS